MWVSSFCHNCFILLIQTVKEKEKKMLNFERASVIYSNCAKWIHDLYKTNQFDIEKPFTLH